MTRDYLSPLQIVSFYTAVRNGHFPVALGILGFFLLKLSVSPMPALQKNENYILTLVQTLFSTGLFILGTNSHPPINLTLLSNYTLFDLGTHVGLGANGFQGADETAPDILYAINERGFDFPRGTTREAAYDFYLPMDLGPYENANISVEVDAFFPIFNCTSMPIKPHVSWTWGGIMVGVSYGDKYGDPYYNLVTICDPTEQACLARQQYSDCTNILGSNENRVQLAVFDVEYSYNTNNTNATISILASEMLVCSVTYSLGRAMLSYSVAGGSVLEPHLSQPITI